MAWFKVHAGKIANEEESKSFCKGLVPHFRILEHVWFMVEFPLTVTGKMQKFRMREMALEKTSKS